MRIRIWCLADGGRMNWISSWRACPIWISWLRAGEILSTVRATRAASQEALVEKAAGLLEEMLAMGVTTCEAKSGYGLCLADELKQLQVIRALQTRQRVELIPTLMAAHAVPEEYLGRSNDYVRLIETEIIPAVAEAGLAKFCDVFCETGVFDVAQSRRVLRAGQKHGLRAKKLTPMKLTCWEERPWRER